MKGHVEPRQMSTRARCYLALSAFMNITIGAPMLFLPDYYTTPSFQTLSRIMPRWIWGLLILGTGFYLAISFLMSHEISARVSLVLSAGVMFLWFGGLVTHISENPLTWILPAFFATMCGKDLVMCSQPLWTPFEDAIRDFIPPADWKPTTRPES